MMLVSNHYGAFDPQHEPTDEDLAIAVEACCANAARCRRRGKIAEAEIWDSVAEEIALAARWPNQAEELRSAAEAGSDRLQRAPALTRCIAGIEATVEPSE